MVKDNRRREAKGDPPCPIEWRRKAPYDFTGCLAHIDLTYHTANLQIIRITGIITHNDSCCERNMKRLPAIPLHNHVWQIALDQLNVGAR